ncbi:granzyme E-like [Rattus rattus]|uniref:granzyme E-like n=1 Tax=Rattus rattus TaxID=10117 RepID=UPI0013F2FA51|nr:granzyme E-like [Rattus rattus]
MLPVQILLTFLLPLGAGAEEIIGGHDVKPHSRPYMAFIASTDTNRSKNFCGGFLIQYKFVLTAAHCREISMTVILGAHNISAQERTQQIIPVEKAIPHPAYNPMDHTNDIMLLKLKRKAKKTKSVRILNLPMRHARLKPGVLCHVAGWGLMSLDATKRPALLQEAELIIQEDHECKKVFRHYSETTEICAGDPKKIQDIFQGDSGGPLVCDNKAYGVVSYGKRRRITSGIFTKVVYFLPWISRKMKLL